MRALLRQTWAVLQHRARRAVWPCCPGSVTCALDTLGHNVGWTPRWLCDRHDGGITW